MSGEGNPNHDPSNGQFSSGGGSSGGGVGKTPRKLRTAKRAAAKAPPAPKGDLDSPDDRIMTLKIGDRVKVKLGKEHDSMTNGKTGTVKAVSTPALGIKFDDMAEMHKWYVEGELDKQ